MFMPPPLRPLIDKITATVSMTLPELTAVTSLPFETQVTGAEEEIAREGAAATKICIVLEGLALGYKLVGPNGRRQIISFFIPGDIPDLMSLHLDTLDSSLLALFPSKLAFIEHRFILDLIRDHPRLGNALWRNTLIDASITREWLAGLGRREAYVRVAHLICELLLRFEAVGLTEGLSIRLPLTQEILGDALGLSTVHINRVLQKLRADHLIVWSHGTLRIMDRSALEAVADFDRQYLHIQMKKPALN